MKNNKQIKNGKNHKKSRRNTQQAKFDGSSLFAIYLIPIFGFSVIAVFVVMYFFTDLVYLIESFFGRELLEITIVFMMMLATFITLIYSAFQAAKSQRRHEELIELLKQNRIEENKRHQEFMERLEQNRIEENKRHQEFISDLNKRHEEFIERADKRHEELMKYLNRRSTMPSRRIRKLK